MLSVHFFLWLLQTGEVGLFDMMSDSKFEEVFREYAWRNKVSPEGVCLSYKGVLLMDDQTPETVRYRCTLHCAGALRLIVPSSAILCIWFTALTRRVCVFRMLVRSHCRLGSETRVLSSVKCDATSRVWPACQKIWKQSRVGRRPSRCVEASRRHKGKRFSLSGSSTR